MNTIAIDTHKTVRKLMEKGYTEKQAEGFVEAITESELVTKSYLDHRFAEFEVKMYRAFLVHGLATVAAVLAAANLL